MNHERFPWRPLGRVLIAKGLLDEEDLEDALAEQRRSGRLLGEILVDQGSLSAVSLARALAEQHGVGLRPSEGAEAPSATAAEPGVSGDGSAARPWRPLGRLLVEQGYVSAAELERALVEQRRTGGRLGEILVARGTLTGPGLARALAEQHGVGIEPDALEAEPAVPTPEPDEGLYEVREVFEGAGGAGTVAYRTHNFLEAADFAFEVIERRDPSAIEIELTRNGRREVVWSYSASAAAAEAESRKGLVDTFGFDPARWDAGRQLESS